MLESRATVDRMGETHRARRCTRDDPVYPLMPYVRDCCDDLYAIRANRNGSVSRVRCRQRLCPPRGSRRSSPSRVPSPMPGDRLLAEAVGYTRLTAPCFRFKAPEPMFEALVNRPAPEAQPCPFCCHRNWTGLAHVAGMPTCGARRVFHRLPSVRPVHDRRPARMHPDPWKWSVMERHGLSQVTDDPCIAWLSCMRAIRAAPLRETGCGG